MRHFCWFKSSPSSGLLSHSPMLTNRRLQKLYKHYSRKYFKGKLPDIPVVFANITYHGAIGNTQFQDRKPFRIQIDKSIRTWETLARFTLLHECCHAILPYKIVHGERFEREMRRLARQGAFTGLW